jgi:hypothetical protein
LAVADERTASTLGLRTAWEHDLAFDIKDTIASQRLIRPPTSARDVEP